jgi:hypothetical protein
MSTNPHQNTNTVIGNKYYGYSPPDATLNYNQAMQNMPAQQVNYPGAEEINQNQNQIEIQELAHQQEHAQNVQQVHHVQIQPEVVEREVIVVQRPMFFSEPFPQLTKTVAWILLFVNIFLPGIGTMIVGCLDVKNPTYFILWGLFQFVTAYFIIGWILAIQTSIFLIIYAD